MYYFTQLFQPNLSHSLLYFQHYVFMKDLHYIQIELHSINRRFNYPLKDVPRVHCIISYRIHFMNAWVLNYQGNYSCIGQIMEI